MACSQRAGDLGRQNRDYVARYVFDDVDRHLMAGGRAELSRLPLTDVEQAMYDRLWRFFSAPHAYEWSPFGKSRVNPVDLKSGKAFEATDKYYKYLRHAGFKSTRGRYTAMTSHIEADLAMLPDAFAAVCAVERLDDQRRTAARGLPELDAETAGQLDMRLIENANVALILAAALDYRYQSYSYALKRLLIETPDEAARDVDAGLSRLAVGVEAAGRGAYCG
ncbi:MAG: hypothetical protein KKH72_13095 [Alphaproteobacteria bacterium]|nr:hypothetical protein [Alphaproteobacteria bacterium]